MKSIPTALFVLVALLPFISAALAQPAPAYSGWQHLGALTILTTPDGANLPAGAAVEGFPLLVRLHKDWFDFKQAKPDGADVRFADHPNVQFNYFRGGLGSCAVEMH